MEAHPSPGRGPGRILLADGDAALRWRIRDALEAAGYAVLEATDGAEALAALAEAPVDLLLAGAGLRCPDGRRLVRAARGRPAPEPAVLALAPPLDARSALDALAAGAHDYVAAEASNQELLVRVHASLHGDRREAALEHAALRRIAVAVARGAAPQAVFDLVAEEVARAHRAAGGAVVRYDEDEAVLVGRWSARPAAWAPGLRLPVDGPLPSARVARTGHPARADDLLALSGVAHWLRGADAFRGAVAAPVRVGDRLWGAVLVATDRPRPLPFGTEDRLERFAELVALAIGNAEARAELAARAATDALTGLVNRSVLDERLGEEVARSRRHGRELSLVLLDVDRFKSVNDHHGHAVGDAVLREAALRLAARAREGDVLARMGGEEFAWLMPETDAMEAWQAAERARGALAGAPFPGVGRVTVSAGVCDLARAGSAEELYRRADVALYWAKHNGRDVVFLYSKETMEAMGEDRRAAELKRRQAFQSIRVLARSVDAKDPSTRRHSERVAGLAAALAERLGWASQRVALLHEAGLVHDVGKIAVPDAILFKPERLSAAELAKVQTHAALGGEMLSDVLRPEQAGWIRNHHERWDGDGYPDGLAGEAIPDGARLLHVADAWDVMTSHRPYVGPMSPEDALAECRRVAGAQFWGPAIESLEALWAAGGLSAEALERRAVTERV